MNPRGHNKKRNTGLLYEFLVRTISKALVEKDMQKSAVALKILKNAFKPGTELYREFRLFNALVTTTVSNPNVAANILQEAKMAARQYDMTKLDREKSLLIRNINHGLKDDNFYDQPISEYKTYATISTLLSDWRDTSSENLGRIAQYEDHLVKWLTTEKPEVNEGAPSPESPGMNRLVFKTMAKKLNEKYSGVLSDKQKGILREYAFFSSSGDVEPVKKKLLELKEEALAAIDAYVAAQPKGEISEGKGLSEFVGKKLSEVRNQVSSEKIDLVDDATITRFMLYAKLDAELASEE